MSGQATCPRCGYKIEGQTQQIPFVDPSLSDNAMSAVKPIIGTPTLTILKGALKGEAFRLSSFPLVVGRDPECDLFLNDPTVTRRHASLDIIDGEVVITDLNSLNGTWVGGAICDRAALKDGDIVQIGTFTMVFNM